MYLVNTWFGGEYIYQLPLLNVEENVDGTDLVIRELILDNNLVHRQPLFARNIWNVSNRVAPGLVRTNNSIESIFNVCNSYLMPHPRLSLFLKRVLKELKAVGKLLLKTLTITLVAE